MVQRSDLFQRVREGVMPYVVQESGRANYRLLLFADGGCVFSFAQEGERASRQVMRAKCVLETGVSRAWIDQIRPPELTHVPQSLKDFRIDEIERELVDPNVIPNRV